MFCCHFCILSFLHGLSPEGAIVGIVQNMVLVSGVQLSNGEVVNFEGVIKTTGSMIVNGDRKYDFSSGLTLSSGKSSKMVYPFVIRKGYSQDYH